MQFVWFLVIGALAGWLAGVIMKGGGFGLIGDLVIGVVGAVLGGLLFSLLQIHAGGPIGQFVMALIGAVVLLALLRVAFAKRRRA